ncbi:hypothetical protein COCSADRAFT_159831 [Bipolaris sorokiniana ND90Pr]|uniref:RecA family profile 1 domain-containing protein n=1 Tax=Cochliobolus sativus (strain ND90Pr / ATCC 201652) TaxID=665912 RepID=M2RDC3_COCSN|nr:uncharacterized protein COCSADRAFT_159831 [Bipolaris sorokiniana ND90Pr]EMD64824.1 hypothetical protein COCSADRAFT_159831 [Bipolaris sorokiniana ND90Pr]
MAGEEASQLSPLSHRLPTVSASQALQDFNARGARTVSTGITQLDKALSVPAPPGHDASGGYTRGKVTEIFGPSGVGKTTFGIQAAVSALREGQRVIWVDAACAPLVQHRIDDILVPYPDEMRSRFQYTVAPTLAHVVALFVHPPASFPPQNTSLIVIDSLATLIDNAYPRHTDDRIAKNRTDQARWAAGRRFAIINELIAAFTRFAALHDLVLLITSQTITRIRGASRALLVPAISGVEWEAGVSTRLVLFRDWVRHGKPTDKSDAERLQRARFAGLVKANGVAFADEGGVGNVVAFTIEKNGLCDISMATNDITAPLLIPTEGRMSKRPFAEIDENTAEEPNSDELYGWMEDDGVATEGLLIDEASIDQGDVATPHLDVIADGHKNKVIRTSPTPTQD